MIVYLLTGLGLVAVIEGLVLALAPLKLEQALELFRRLDIETRRHIGLVAVGIGVALIWLARLLTG